MRSKYVGGVGLKILLGSLFAPALSSIIALSPARSGVDYRSGSLSKNEPQAIYSSDPRDSWNRIFYCLFTRTVKTRLAKDFPEGAPFAPLEMMGHRDMQASKNLFERIESGDRAIDPLYPSFFTSIGPSQALEE